MNIIILSPFFYPENISTGRYNTHLVKRLKDLGHQITVFSSFPFYPDWKPQKSHLGMDGVSIKRGGYFKYHRNIFIRRIQLELWFAFYILRNFVHLKDADQIISVFPPVFFGLIIGIFFKGKHTIIVHDLQSVMSSAAGSQSENILAEIIGFVEKTVYLRCKKIIFLSKSMRNAAENSFNAKFPNSSVCYPFTTLVNSVNKNKLHHYFPYGHKHIVYSGALGEKQNPKGLVKLFKLLNSGRQDTTCHIFSSGPYFEYFKGREQELANCRVYLHNIVEDSLLTDLYRKSYVQIIPQVNGTSSGAIPSKLPNIAKANCPVFCITDNNSELREILLKCQIPYKCHSSWNISDLYRELSSFIDQLENQLRPSSLQELPIFNVDHLIHQILS